MAEKEVEAAGKALRDFEIKATGDAVTALGPRLTAIQLTTLVLLATAWIWALALSTPEVEVPILKVKVLRLQAAQITGLLAACCYFIANVFNAYRRILEDRLENLLRKEHPEFRLPWTQKYPSLTLFLGNARDSGWVGVVASGLLVVTTVLVPAAFLALFAILGWSRYSEASFLVTSLASMAFVSLGVLVFALLTPSVEGAEMKFPNRQNNGS